ncbi:MAG: putative rane bound transporter [Planctomycetaceae bacterium]|nr:putative rane bound transporter [Planctomycetaceae bacterium]
MALDTQFIYKELLTSTAALGILCVILPVVVIRLIWNFTGSPSRVIARATTTEAVRQPVFILMIVLGIVVNLLNAYIPFFTLGEDVKMLKDCGLATLLISGLILAVWTASTSIADEIEGKTAMTLLSKPINRRQFIFGKYIGILQAVLLMYLPTVLWFLFCIYVKVPYDGKEGGKTDITAMECWSTMVQTIPGIVLIIFEVSVMTAVSVAISTRLPMVVNMVSCLAIFVIGHLTPALVDSGSLRLELVEFMARMFATVLPALEVFNIQAAIATGAEVPKIYLLSSLLYTVCYAGMAILLAFIMFEDRDLA